MTNFDFLKEQKQFSSFANTAIAAERIFSIDAASCAINCRKAMELAIKWMYSVDTSLSMPYQEKLVTLLNTEGFQKIVGREILKRLNFIRALGNNAAHSTRAISTEQARYALENLISLTTAMARAMRNVSLILRFWSRNRLCRLRFRLMLRM